MILTVLNLSEHIHDTSVSENVGIRILLTTVCKPYGVPDEDAKAHGMQAGRAGARQEVIR